MKIDRCWFFLLAFALGSSTFLSSLRAEKVAFIAGSASHGYGAHEHYAGAMLLAETLEKSGLGIETVVHRGWPKDDQALRSADTIVIYCDGGGGHVAIPHREQMQSLMDAGKGLVCLHYAVEVPKGQPGNDFLNWLGGYFETDWSVNPHWEADFNQLPDSPVTRGVQPFKANDEWYFHMRFRPEMAGVTPILQAVAPEDTMRRPDGPHSGNPDVRKSVAAGEPQVTAWTFERPDGGRSFGFTGGHYHWNWGRPDLLRLVSNAIVWTAGVQVPQDGVSLEPVAFVKLKENQDFDPPENFDDKQTAEQFKVTVDSRAPENAISGITIPDDLEATLVASEPQLKSLTNLDIDDRGRIWVIDVVNYRGNNGKRPEGDRILILEDLDQDGVADDVKVFYQGRDIDSAMGICVLGNEVIVSAAPYIWRFIDEDGDDVPDQKIAMFTETGQPQHDHSNHSFLFGPDGKLYWNFGNTGQAVKDAAGKVVVDVHGREIIDNGKPFFGGMPFRCDLDGSNMEVLAHNFRNNWETTIDSFGTLWQSDNDDDGNRGVRINFVMEHGNYGYRDQLTGASWQENRIGIEDEIPLRHWHLNDPGVVPNLLQTGAGSPTGICIYEGRLLPERFWDEMIHCDAGPNVVRAYPVQKSGAGYTAEILPIMTGTEDQWFRPADVCVAPDGSLFVTDWYDPGVGGHRQEDSDRGRLFRIAPPGTKYIVPKFDYTTPEGAVEALANPNLSTRYKAWTALHAMGESAEPALLGLWRDENPRLRARALWLLGKIPGKAEQYVMAGLDDSNEDLRITAIRLARQTGVSIPKVVGQVLENPTKGTLRESAIALRFCDDSSVPELWAQLALHHDGKDRWYLEALGIASDGQPEACMAAWLKQVGSDWDTPAGRDIVWRVRAPLAAAKIALILNDPSLSSEQLDRYFRAMDFHSPEVRAEALESIIE